MEIRGNKLKIDSSGGEEQRFKFDPSKEISDFNYEKFHSACAEIFQSDEIEQEESKLREIFDLFDSNKDGVLTGRERKIFASWLKLKPVNALLIVDVQNDFIDGSLALRRCDGNQDGADVVKPINRLIKNACFDKIIYSQDWHLENHISFYENLHLRELHADSKVTKENAKPFDTVIFADPCVEQILWPKHCVMDTWGAELHKDLIIAPGSEQVRKGQNSEVESYSVFFDQNFQGSMELQSILRKSGVNCVYVCGLAYDVCVKATCLDGLRLGHAIAVIDDCCRGVDNKNSEIAKQLIAENGGLITDSDNVLSIVNGKKRNIIMSHQLARSMTLTAFSGTSTDSSE
ncbi:PREDICTED: pyrazinamidase/nicotinamidase-like [Habropoda laboriosa]|uniref:pyrazinamidase/nicotinamidase-like n=1 Tax=Habropoda laboriosa TaxID=597456 RepID=UPI00083D6275|nr:PREDICTED: pyrazinamidase/nicotinamidase-like [Habropoda laboriosa]